MKRTEKFPEHMIQLIKEYNPESVFSFLEEHPINYGREKIDFKS